VKAAAGSHFRAPEALPACGELILPHI